MRHIGGYVHLSSQLLRETERAEQAMLELEWIAHHWDEATEEQRARFRAFQEAQREMEDLHDDRD